MQPKSAIFISAALTTFVLAILAGVVSALKNPPAAVETTQPPAIVTSAPVLEIPTAEPSPTVTPPAVFGPMEAVSVASQFMNQQDVYSVESSTYNQAPVFKVTFSSGDIVYVGLDGQVISAEKPQPVVVNIAPTQPPKKAKSSNNNNSSQSSNKSEGEHEHEHEDGDD